MGCVVVVLCVVVCSVWCVEYCCVFVVLEFDVVHQLCRCNLVSIVTLHVTVDPLLLQILVCWCRRGDTLNIAFFFFHTDHSTAHTTLRSSSRTRIARTTPSPKPTRPTCTSSRTFERTLLFTQSTNCPRPVQTSRSGRGLSARRERVAVSSASRRMCSTCSKCV